MHEESLEPGSFEPVEPAAAPSPDGPESSTPGTRKVRSPSARRHDPERRKMLKGAFSKMRRQATDTRRRALARTFDLAERAGEMAKDLPKSHIVAFLEEECRVPRRQARRYFELGEILGPERGTIERSAIDVTLLFEILRQPESVREEAMRMLRADRKLSAASLRAMRRDVLAREEIEAGTPRRRRCDMLKAAAAKHARARTEAFLKELEILAENAEAVEEDRPEAPAPEAVEAEAARLLETLDGLVPAERLSGLAEKEHHTDPGWESVRTALKLVSEEGKVLPGYPDEWRPWQIDQWSRRLSWPFGNDGTKSGGRPLETRPRRGAWRPSPYRCSVLELCAGAGGQALGLHAAGFFHSGLVEANRDAVATLRANKSSWKVIEGDLRSVDLSNYRGVDLVAAGLPCQPFSQSGKGRGSEDERDLFDRMLEIVAELRPRAVMIENVPGIFNNDHVLGRINTLARFDQLGYDMEWRLVEGPHFGLAQKRRRTILVALKRGTMHRFRWPAPLNMVPPTVGTLLRDLMGARGWKGLEEWVEKANKASPTVTGGSDKKGGNDLGKPKTQKAWAELGIDASGLADELPGPDFVGMPRLTPAMLARLQDFPDEWQFVGSRKSVRMQIGNAFPPRLARVMGLSLLRALTGQETDLATAIGTPIPLKTELAELAQHRWRKEPEEEAFLAEL